MCFRSAVQWDIGEFYRFAALVDYTSDDFCILFLGTFNEDAVIFVGYLHRIESYHLTDGLLDGQVGEVAGYSEVFQFVVDEVNRFLAGRGVQVFENLRKRLVQIAAANPLCLGAQRQNTE